MSSSVNTSIDKKILDISCVDNYAESAHIPQYISHANTKKILVLSGGGTKGVALLGACAALHDRGILPGIDTFVGTSIGAVISLLLIIGYSPNNIFNFVKIFDFKKLKHISLSCLLENYGLSNGDTIMHTIEKFVVGRNLNSNITFNELFDITRKKIIITATNVNRVKLEYFSASSHGHMPVLLAIKMAIAVPFLFSPVSYDGMMYVDGGCIENFSVRHFSNEKDRLIGIYIDGDYKVDMHVNTLSDYAISIINSVIKGRVESSIIGFENCVVGLILHNINPMNFDLTTEIKEKMYGIGYTTVMNFKF